MAIYYADQGKNKIRLLQSSKAKLSTFISNEGKIKSIINCSFFTNDYVIGRDQGDERNNTVDLTNFEGNSIVIFKDGGYKIGYYNSWDYQSDVVAGFSPCAIFRNGQLEVAPSLKDKWSPNSVINRTALCYNDEGFHFVVATKINYEDLLNAIWEKYKAHFVAFLDSGGSSEIIKDSVLQFTPSDGVERNMFNGLAFVEIEDKPEPTPTPEPSKDIILRYPCTDGWGSQEYHDGHKGLDIGWVKIANSPIQACADGVVEFEGVYPETFKDGKTYYPIGVIIRHPQFSNDYDLISIYWHLAKTIIDKGMSVKEGQEIGTKGNTGNSGGVHLHFQLIKVAKGAEVPKSNAWADISIDPTNLLRVHKDQLFDEEKSKFILKKYEGEEEPEESEEIKELKKKITGLELQVKELESKLKEQENILELTKLELTSAKTELANANKKLSDVKEIVSK